MDEIVRIKSEGWLKEEFWQPRIVCDFQISIYRIELWAILLDIFRKFVQVCEKYKLSYFAISGTALGAVRHSGFIPWDDDMDFVMPREDYNKLIKLKSEFEWPYSLTYPSDEPGNGFSFLRIHNSNTLGTSKTFKNLDINHGISIDIFPLDSIDMNNSEKQQQVIKELVISNSEMMKMICSNTQRKNELEPIIKSNFLEIENKACIDNDKVCSHVGIRTSFIVNPNNNKWKKEIFSDYLFMQFEGIPIRMPVLWEDELWVEYGDWKLLPPIEERGKWHSNLIYNTKLDYKTALDQGLYSDRF